MADGVGAGASGAGADVAAAAFGFGADEKVDMGDMFRLYGDAEYDGVAGRGEPCKKLYCAVFGTRAGVSWPVAAVSLPRPQLPRPGPFFFSGGAKVVGVLVGRAAVALGLS